MRKGIFIGLIIALLFIVFLTGFFIKKGFLVKPFFFVKNLFNNSGDLYRENLLLKQQNEDLRAQIQKFQVSNFKFQVSSDEYLSAKIFSTYPFNIKNQLIIDVGSKQGVKKLMAVTVGENILIGQIVEVFEDSSVVKTIFDPRWQLPVRIGKNETNGLLQGGNEPKITLIDKPVNAGDVVYSASSEFPYALKIGEIFEIRQSASGIFKEATIKLPYNINELREINVRK